MDNVEQYIADHPEMVSERIKELRRIIADALPNTTQDLKWGSLAFMHEDGMILVIIGTYKHHCNVVVTPSAMDEMRSKFQGFDTGKGSVKIPHDAEVPVDLVTELVQRRSREYMEDGVKWM